MAEALSPASKPFGFQHLNEGARRL